MCVSCCVLLLVVAIKCGEETARADREANEAAAIKYTSQYLLSSSRESRGKVLRTSRLLCLAVFVVMACR